MTNKRAGNDKGKVKGKGKGNDKGNLRLLEAKVLKRERPRLVAEAFFIFFKDSRLVGVNTPSFRNCFRRVVIGDFDLSGLRGY